MRTYTCSRHLVLLAVWFLVGVSAKIVAQENMRVDYPPSPASLEALWKEADFVVLGKIGVVRTDVVPSPHGVMVFRVYDIAIIQDFKREGSSNQHRQLRVGQMGGTTRMDGRSVTSPDDMRRLTEGTQEFLFLLRWPGRNYNLIAYGPSGAFEVRDGQVHIIDSAWRATHFAGRRWVPASEFTNFLMAIEKKSR